MVRQIFAISLIALYLCGYGEVFTRHCHHTECDCFHCEHLYHFHSDDGCCDASYTPQTDQDCSDGSAMPADLSQQSMAVVSTAIPSYLIPSKPVSFRIKAPPLEGESTSIPSVRRL